MVFGDPQAMDCVAVLVTVLCLCAVGTYTDGVAEHDLARIGVRSDADGIIVLHDDAVVNITGRIKIRHLQARCRHWNTHVPLHSPPEELLVIRVLGNATRVSPPGMTLTSPRPFYTE